MEIRKQSAHAEALVRTATQINSKLELAEVLSSVCEETARALAVPAAALYLLNERSQSMSLAADFGFSDSIRRRSIQIPVSAFEPGKSPNSDAPVIIQDAQAVAGLPYPEVLRSMDIRTIVSVRIVHKGTFVGTLSIYSVGKVRQFMADEIALLEGLSNQAAQAITNAHLYENAERQLKNVKALRNIDGAIASSLDVNLTLNVVAEEAIRQLGVDASDILLYKKASRTLESAVSQGFNTSVMRKVTLRVGEGIAGQIAYERQRIFIPDLSSYKGENLRVTLFTGEDFVSYCGVPLRAKGLLIGVLEIFTRTRSRSRSGMVLLHRDAGRAGCHRDRQRKIIRGCANIQHQADPGLRCHHRGVVTGNGPA